MPSFGPLHLQRTKRVDLRHRFGEVASPSRLGKIETVYQLVSEDGRFSGVAIGGGHAHFLSQVQYED